MHDRASKKPRATSPTFARLAVEPAIGPSRDSWSVDMKFMLMCVVLFLVIPMVALNPYGREAFLGYYAGVVATWAAYILALQSKAPLIPH